MGTHPIRGIFLIILSMLLFSVSYSLFKPSNDYLPNTLIILFQSFFCWLIITPFAVRKGMRHLKTNQLLWIIARTVFGVISLYCISKALRTATLAEVILLNNTSPLFVPVVAYLWMKTPWPRHIWVGLLVGFIGIYVVLRPGFDQFVPGQIFGLCAGISGGILLVVMRKIAHEPLLRVLFYYFLFFCLFLSPFLFTNWSTPPLFIWLFLFASAIAMVAAQLLLTASFRYATSHEVAPFIYTSVIFAGLIDWIVWDQTIDLISLLGMAIVCLGGIISLFILNKKRVAP